MSALPAPVRLLRPDDVSAAADLHRRSFPDYQSTRFGAGYCRRLLRAYAAHPDAWVEVAPAGDGGIVGYLVAAPPVVQREVDRSLLRWAALCSLRHPVAVVRSLSATSRRVARLVGLGGRSASESSDTDAPLASLRAHEATVRVVLVAVDPVARGRGVADALLHEFAGLARRRGHEVADLSVAADNRAAQRAYERNGWSAAEGEAGGATHYRLDLRGLSSP